MKSYIKYLLVVFIVITTLCGCSAEESTNSSLPQEDNMTFLCLADETEIYYKTVETTEYKLDLVLGKNGNFNSVREVPMTEYRVVDKNGNSLINQPFDSCDFADVDSWVSLNHNLPTLYGSYRGNYYWYVFSDGVYKLSEEYISGEYDTVKSDDGKEEYILTRYAYNSNYKMILKGVNAKDGSVILEPLFTKIYIPFENRFIAKTNFDTTDDWCGVCSLVDQYKNRLCTYTSIMFYHFDDGTYIGIAWYAGADWGHIIKDDLGNIIPTGHRFIDKDGNELSRCFDLNLICENENIFVESHLDDILISADENGNTVKFTAREYICKE